MSNDVDRPPLTALTGVRYNGSSDWRIISGDDFDAIGIKYGHSLIWEKGETIPVHDLNAAVVDHLATDHEFTLIPKTEDPGDDA